MADEDVLEQQTDEETGPEPTEGEGEKPSLQEQLKEKIGVNVEEVGPLRKKLTVAVPREFITAQLDEQYSELRRDANVPGFRKGRAPRRLLEKRFGSEVGDTLVQQLVTTGYMAAVEKIDLKVIGDPMVWIREKGSDTPTLVDVQKALDTIELPAEGALEFSCEVEVRPEFELPELKNIPIQRPNVTVSDEDINRHLERVRGLRGHYHTLPDGAVESDDVIMADIRMTSGGVEIKQQENVRMAARPQTIDGVPIDNLGEALKGARVGDLRQVSGQISDDYVKEEYRGKTAEFEIKVREIQRLHLPELNEEFIKSIGFDNEQELRDWAKADLESRLSEQVHRAMAGQVYRYLLDNTKFELPERLSDRQTGRVMVRRMLDLYRQGMPPAEVEKHLDQVKTGAREDTLRDLKVFFIMEKLAEKIEVDINESEINNVIAGIAQRQGRRFDRVRDELAKDNGLVNIYMQIRDEKIVDQLIAEATITEIKPAEGEVGRAAAQEPSEQTDAAPAAQGEVQEDEAAGAKSKPRRTPPGRQAGDSDAT